LELATFSVETSPGGARISTQECADLACKAGRTELVVVGGDVIGPRGDAVKKAPPVMGAGTRALEPRIRSEILGGRAVSHPLSASRT
jgi:hypothetical protein